MPALYAALTGAETGHLARRDLSVNHTQAVTLGVMGAYVVVIAILWNVPYIRWVLWPFKVNALPTPYMEGWSLTIPDAGYRIS